eukprot:scaffold39812_cov255-Skeletonema_dohrnii-CCMP3373.AAC.1
MMMICGYLPLFKFFSEGKSDFSYLVVVIIYPKLKNNSKGTGMPYNTYVSTQSAVAKIYQKKHRIWGSNPRPHD